jgi:hypothetical protein
MENQDVQQKLADRVFAIGRQLDEPLRVEPFGNSFVTVSEGFKKGHLNGFWIKKMQKNFKNVHLINGEMVIS